MSVLDDTKMTTARTTTPTAKYLNKAATHETTHQASLDLRHREHDDDTEAFMKGWEVHGSHYLPRRHALGLAFD